MTTGLDPQSPRTAAARLGRMVIRDPMPSPHTPFAVYNRTVNPVVRLVLHSRLHRLLSGRLALVTVTGRRSGRRFTIPVGYRRVDGRVEIVAGWPERKRSPRAL